MQIQKNFTSMAQALEAIGIALAEGWHQVQPVIDEEQGTATLTRRGRVTATALMMIIVFTGLGTWIYHQVKISLHDDNIFIRGDEYVLTGNQFMIGWAVWIAIIFIFYSLRRTNQQDTMTINWQTDTEESGSLRDRSTLDLD